MTFANRNRGGSLVYARSLFASLREQSDIAAWVIAGPQRSGLAGTLAWLLRGARQAIASKPPDILHCPSFVAPWRIDVPIVVTVHDAATRRFPRNHPLEWRVYDRRFMPRQLHAAARVITGSEFARREVIDLYGVDASKVVAVPYGLDARMLGAPLRDEPEARDPVILFPGAPVGRKNLDAVLRCMRNAQPDDALGRATLEITGADARDFPLYSRMIADLGLAKRVMWRGHLSNDEMIEAIEKAAVVAYPSLYEGFGFPPLEAMALGTPVVASDRGSLPEVLGDGALVVDPLDDRALAQALEAVLTRPELRSRLRGAGWAQARRFTWSRCAEQTHDVYRAVLDERRVAA